MNGHVSLIQRLTDIYNASQTATSGGPNSSAFRAWHTEARDALIAAVGAHDPLVVEFDNIKFDVSDDAAFQSFRERLKKMRIITSEEKSNVTRIHTPPSPDSTQEQRFLQVVTLACEILLAAKVQLQVGNDLGD